MSGKYLPPFEYMRRGEGEGATEVQVSKSGDHYANLIEFNGIPVATLLARAAGADADAQFEDFKNNVVAWSIEERVKKSADPAAATASLGEQSVKSHSGFVAKIASVNRPGRSKSIKIMALTREGHDEKCKLVTAMFEAALTFASRAGLSPEDVSAAFARVAPDGDVGDMMMETAMKAHGMGGAGGGGANSAAQMQAMMMQQMMGAMGGGGGGGGPGGPRGGGGGGGQPECQQQ